MQGLGTMYPTAISQIIENSTKAFVGIGLVVLLLNHNQPIPIVIGGAATGISIGFIVSSIYLVYAYMQRRSELSILRNCQEEINTYDF